MPNLTDDIKHTAYYRSVREEVFLEVVQKLLERGDSIEEIAITLKIDVEQVRKLANQDK